MSALVFALACAVVVPGPSADPAVGASDLGAGAVQAPATAQASERDATLERWRESLALDLPSEVLADGAAAIRSGGALADDGEALALYARALVAARADGVEAALELLDAAQPSPRTRDHVVLERIRCQLHDDDLSGALIALLPDPKAQEPRLPERADSWLLAGRAWARSGSLERAAPFLARYLELAPRDREAPAALHLLAQAALSRGDGRTAHAAVQRAEELARWHALWKVRVLQVREQPGEPLPRIGLAQLWLQAGDPARAKAILTETCERFPGVASGHFHLGEAERGLGNLAAAAAAYGRALELEPDHVLARHNRGTIHRLEGRLAQARADFEANADGPRSADPRVLASHLGLARVLVELGEADAAARRYARYAELGGREPLGEPRK